MKHDFSQMTDDDLLSGLDYVKRELSFTYFGTMPEEEAEYFANVEKSRDEIEAELDRRGVRYEEENQS